MQRDIIHIGIAGLTATAKVDARRWVIDCRTTSSANSSRRDIYESASVTALHRPSGGRTPEEIARLVDNAVLDASAESRRALIDDLVAQEADIEVDENGSAGRVGLKSGGVSELTSIVDLKPGGADRLRRIFAMVRGNFSGANRVATLHDMRFVFLENDTKMLFATTYDGDWDTYIDDFAMKIPALTCEG
jgi:hypothetical protein